MGTAKDYKDKLEELIHFLNTQLSTINLASSSLIDSSNNTDDSEEFLISLDLIRSAIKKINQQIQAIESTL